MHSLPSPSIVSSPRLRVIRDEDAPPYDGETTPKRAAGFAMIPAEIFAMKDGQAIAVYAVLAKHANRDGVCWPSMQTLADALGWHIQTVRKVMARLVGSGAVTIERRKFHGMDQANAYRLQAFVQGVTESPPVVIKSPLGGDQITSGWGPNHHEQEPIELDPKEQEGVIPPTPQKAKPKRKQYTPEFEAFWSAYPTDHGVKSESFAQWERLTDEERARAVADLPKWVASDRWRRGYIRDCQRWLKYREWEQTPTPAGSATAFGNGNGHRKLSVSEQNAMVFAKLMAEAEAEQHGGEVIDAYAEVRR